MMILGYQEWMKTATKIESYDLGLNSLTEKDTWYPSSPDGTENNGGIFLDLKADEILTSGVDLHVDLAWSSICIQNRQSNIYQRIYSVPAMKLINVIILE